MKARNPKKPVVLTTPNVFEKRFQMMMKLYRIHQMLKNTKIVYPTSK